jgi:hypothetical protein
VFTLFEFAQRHPVVAIYGPDRVNWSAFDGFDCAIRTKDLGADDCVDFTCQEATRDDASIA